MNNEKDINAKEVVKHMMQHDLFSQWLGIEVLEIKEQVVVVREQIQEQVVAKDLVKEQKMINTKNVIMKPNF